MANRSRRLLLNGTYHNTEQFMLPLVTTLHPSTTVLTTLTKQSFNEAHIYDPAMKYLFPQSSIVVAYKKLPNLQLLMCKNDQNSLAMSTPPVRKNGYLNTNCKCLVCKASSFGKTVQSPAMPGFLINLPEDLTCKAGPGVVYHIVCTSTSSHCQYAQYVGRAWTSNNTVNPMAARWSNHKSHFKHGFNGCRLTDHLLKFHKGDDPQKILRIKILQSANTLEELKRLELIWTRRLFSFEPTGLNVREEEDQ